MAVNSPPPLGSSSCSAIRQNFVMLCERKSVINFTESD